VGLALVDEATDAIHRAYAVAGGAAAACEVAAQFAGRVVGEIGGSVTTGGSIGAGDGLDRASCRELVEVLWRDWCEGSTAGTEWISGAGPEDARLRVGFEPNLQELSHTPIASRGHSGDGAPDWAAIRSHLESAGLEVRSRPLEVGSVGHPRPIALEPGVWVFEVVDAQGVVVAEGKGLSEAQALHSALGEAVERRIAQSMGHAGLFLASQQELEARGIRTPRLEATGADLFSPRLPMEWVGARTLAGTAGALPAEMVLYPYSRGVPVKAFRCQHTAGLAAGAGFAEAVGAALLETIETDGYWLSMRMHRLVGTFNTLATTHTRVTGIVQQLAAAGIRAHAGLINFDWPLSVVHVVLESQNETLPALAHGLGSGLTHERAIERALLEAVQVYLGLRKVVAEYWPQISLQPHALTDPALIWSSPSFSARVTEMFEQAPAIEVEAPREGGVECVGDLMSWLEQRGMVPWVVRLGELSGLTVVRVVLEGGVSAFSERGGPSRRVLEVADRLGVRGLHFDAVLT
jgi:thiazole/oxazole-forming peptide maturase SagD family component